MKRVLCCILVLVFCLGFALASTACSPRYEDATTTADVQADLEIRQPTMSDYTLDPQFDASTVRFAFYSPDTGWVEDVNNAPFDETKPTVIYSHGQGGDSRMFTPEGMYNEGYNVISFLWGCMADDALTPIEQKIWQRIAQYTVYENGKTVFVKSDKFDCTVTELFVARYCDFFALHPQYNMPIRLAGHSYGGQLTFALATYMTTLAQENRLSARLIPERYTLLDPYFDNQIIDFECRWLGRTLHYSSVGSAIYAYTNILAPNNIAIEMLRTSPLVEMATVMGVGDDNAPDYFAELKPLFRVVELNNINELRDQLVARTDDMHLDMTAAMGYWHSVANHFYWSPRAKSVYTNEDGVVIFGRENAASLVLATRGMHFDWWIDEEAVERFENVTMARTITEDEDGNTNENDTVLAGLVMADANGNGKADDKACNRLTNATVIITDNATKQSTEIKTVSGYYRFEATRGATYTVEVHAGNYQSVRTTVTASAFVNLCDVAMQTK